MELELLKWFIGSAGAVISVLVGFGLKIAHDIGKLKGTTGQIDKSVDKMNRDLIGLTKAVAYLRGNADAK